jgi:SAM-dependent methyltransferase
MIADNDVQNARRFFDAIARRYDRVYALSGAQSRTRLARVLRELEGRSRVLVLGLGTGRELPALLDAGHVVTGFDISPEMIAVCNRRSRTVPVVEGDFWAALPFEAASFDAVIALHGTVAHPPSAHALGDLALELARVLAVGGVFVAEVPAAEALARITAKAPSGVSLSATGPRSFVHRDDVSRVTIEGVALDAEGWCEALAPALAARAEPLGDVEHLVIATRRSCELDRLDGPNGQV